MKLFLVENESEIIALIEKYGGLPDSKWVACSPCAMAELEKRKMQFLIPEKFYGSEEFSEVLCTEASAKVNKLIELSLADIREIDPWYEENGIDVLKYYVFPLITLFDSVIYRVFALGRLIERLNPSKIYACLPDVATFRDGYLYNMDANLWTLCARLMGVPVETMKTSRPAKGLNVLSRGLIKERLYRLIIRNGFVYNLYKYFRGGNNPFYRGHKNILLLGEEFEWRFTYGLFNVRGYRIRRIPDIGAVRRHGKTHVDVSFLRSDKYSEVFSFGPVDFRPLLRPAVESIIKEGIADGKGYFSAGMSYIERHRPQALLLSVMSQAGGWFFAKAFKNRGVPVIVWAHGGVGMAEYAKQIYEDLMEIDYYFTQGDGVSSKYMEYAERFGFSPVSIGYPSLDRLKENRRHEKDIDVLYVTTNYQQNNYHASFMPARTDNEFYNAQREILSYLCSSGARVVFKTHPAPFYKTPPVRLTENVRRIGGETALTELIPRARAVLLDIPTTTLIQSASTDVPVFVLMKFIKVTGHAMSLLKRRAVTAIDTEGLLRKLDDFLTSGSYPADVKDRAFIRAYGTHLDDGKGAERAVDEVIRIIHRGI